jgi:hypothetical protein
VPAVIFQGLKVKALKERLQLNTGATIISVNVDPTVTPVDANAGDCIISTLTKNIYIKQTSGNNTSSSSAGSISSFTATSVPFADGSGNLTEDTDNLNYNYATNTLNLNTLSTNNIETSAGDLVLDPVGNVDVNSNKILNVGTPTLATDAANKAYVDAISETLDLKASVRATTTANITLSAPQTIDGVSVIAGDRVLVKDQSTGSENGIYVVAAGAWSRSTDADSDAEVTAGMFTFVEEGTLNNGTGWVLITNNPIVVGTTALSFTQFSSAGVILAGDGLVKTGDTLDVQVDGLGIEIVTNELSIELDGSTLSKSATGLKVATDGITNTEVAAAAAIARSKLANGTANRVAVNNGSGVLSDNAAITASRALESDVNGLPTHSTVTSTELSYVSGVTSAIQTQLNNITSNGVVGPGVSVDSEIALFNGTGGGTLKSATVTGVLKGTAGVLSASNVSLTSEVTGILPIANGGTNSSTTLNNNRVVISSGSALVEHSAITANRALASNASGLPTASATTDTELGFVSGVTSAIQTQLNSITTAAADVIVGPASAVDSQVALFDGITGKLAKASTASGVAKLASGVLSASNVDLTSEVTGVLPIANGGTNSSAALNNNRIAISSGGALVEAAALTDGQLLIGDTGAAPVAANITAGTGISVVNGAGTITINNTASGSVGDIPETLFAGANNQVSADNVTGFLFANAGVRAFRALVSVHVDATTPLFQVFEMRAVQRGSSWSLSQTTTGDDSLVNFTISTSGQILYTSGNYTGFTALNIRFRAEVLGV